MNLSPDDPRLTAYALGELPADEAAEMESAIKKSPELQALVAEIRQTADLLKGEFAAEPVQTFSRQEKERVVASVPAENVISLPQRSFWRTAGIGAIAASILALITWQSFRNSQDGTGLQMAKSRPKQSIAASSAPPPAAEADRQGGATQSKDIVVAQAPALEEPESLSKRFERPQKNTARESKEKQRQDASLALGEIRSDLNAKAEIVGSLSEGRVPATPSAQSQSVAIPKIPQGLADLNAKFGEVPAATATFSTAAKAPAKATPPTMTTAGAVATDYGLAGGAASRAALVPSGGTVNYGFDSLSQSIPNARPNVRTFYAQGDYEIQRNYDSLQGRPEKLTLAEEELAELQLRYTDRHPSVVRQKKKIQDLRRESPHDTARYPKYVENDFESVTESPLSTFSIDVDTASYANLRRFLNEGRMPPRDAVRIEEMINYFSYNYPQPKEGEPFSVNMEVASCPWEPQHQLLRVGLKGKEMAQNKRPASNFVFLIDVSGSMSPQERLPLIKQSLRMLVKRMTENDRIAIVVYASSSGVVLESTSCVNKEKILEALDRLEAGGSTNGGQGIQRAYSLAEEHFIKGGVNRVILCTDGDFNVGITNQEELINLIQRKAKTGVFLSVLGVGTDNYKDALMQKLADKGNGNYHYLDTVEEAHKVLVQQMNGTLVTIAKDVKIQIEFNPAKVSSYRLIGYEKRLLAAEDFNNDKKDAGEIGAGHTVTALYELVPAGNELAAARGNVDELKYQRTVPAEKPSRTIATKSDSNEMLTVKLRYKKPEGDKSVLREHPLLDSRKKYVEASSDFRFAAAVASFGMVMKNSDHKGAANFGSVLALAKESKGDDKEGYRSEFINLVKKARELKQGDADND